MRKIFLISLVTLMISTFINAQDFVFFSNSPTNTSYDPSWGYVNSPSILERVGEKFPVSEDHFYSAPNSLMLHWTSMTGGDWGFAVAEAGWIGHDINQKDTLSFWVFTETLITSANLPLIYLEDLNNTKTEKISITSFSNDIQASVWTNIKIPIQIFKDNAGSADLTKIKTIFYGQNIADGTEHTLYLDEIRMTSEGGGDITPPSVPIGVSSKGYQNHIDVMWSPNTEEDLDAYNIYRLENNTYIHIGNASKDDRFFTDYIGETGISNSYKVTAVDWSMNESGLSEATTSETIPMSDDELLTMLVEANFRYFWDYAHPVSGLTRERYGSENTVTMGGSGMGVMAILVGIEREFITRAEGIERMLKILNFLENDADRFHGAYPHWMNGETGAAIPFSQKDDGGDLVETAFLIQGLLTARQYFDKTTSDEMNIRDLITNIWESVEWSWYRRTPSSNVLYWHWSPNYGWEMNFQLIGWNETMITYLLAIASPTYPIPASMYHDGWAGASYYLNGKSFYGYQLDVGWDYGGPLFFAHYSFLGFDPRGIKDDYTNYFINNRDHTLINRAYCIENPGGFAGYDENTWGLTASDDPFGYSAHEPFVRDNGTITPTAALSSMPYTPTESIAAFKNFYNNYGEEIWGIYGFRDAFNPQQNWYASSYLAIDQGPIIIMVENYRTSLLWNLFMANPEIQPMLNAIGFKEDLTDLGEETSTELDFKLYENYPNPFNPSTQIKYSIPNTSNVKLEVFNLIGEKISTLVNEEKQPGTYEVSFNGVNLSSGVYFYKISTNQFSDVKKLMLLK
ncbi:MAG: T9SS type A sorting domain-containing protein [Melioribacteraceae bacterium]|nr:T9SS type A sorting domain-containing protein [Melioribacteraceae bacterium]